MNIANLELKRLGHGNTSVSLPALMVSNKRRNHWEHTAALPGLLVGQPQNKAGSLG